MKTDYQKRFEQWNQFNQWEKTASKIYLSTLNFKDILNWANQVIELQQSLSFKEIAPINKIVHPSDEKITYIQNIREKLSRLKVIC